MNVALLLSGGIGSRLGGDIPKQYIEIHKRPVIAYCLEQLFSSEMIDLVQIVAADEWTSYITKYIELYDQSHKFHGFSKPGENRQMSIYHGLLDIKASADAEDYVFIHDAARPLLTEKLITNCILAAEEHDGALPVLAMKDTVYGSKDGKRITGLLKRSELFAGQAPEVFVYGKYLEANERLLPDEILEINGSTEPAIMAGMDIAMIPGEENNFKITTSADMVRFKEIIEAERG